MGISNPAAGVRRAGRAQAALVLAALLTLALYFVPFGHYVLYPLMLFSTFAHEMGHGLAAASLGSTFEMFRMWADGSGLATYTGRPTAFGRAVISAGGLLGPSALALIFFMLGRHAAVSRVALYGFGIGCIAADIFVVRNAFGFAFVGVVALLCILIAHKTDEVTTQVVTVFLAIQLSLSVFSRSDYLFMESANTAGGKLPSDTAQIAASLGGPYWLWGIVVGALSLAILVGGMWGFMRALKSP